MTPAIVFLNPWPAGLAVAAAAVGLALLAALYKRFSVPASGRLRAALFALRLALLLFLVVALLNPHREKSRQSNARWLGVMVDVSSSMGLRDLPGGGSRMGWVKQFLTRDPLWQEVKAKCAVRLYAVGEELRRADRVARLRPLDSESRLLEAADALARERQDPQCLGFVLFSDGNDTAGAEEPGELEAPIVTVRVGSPGDLPDIRLTAVEMPSWAYLREKVLLTVRWEAVRLHRESARLRVAVDRTEVFNENVALALRSAQVPLAIAQAGDHRVEVMLGPLAAEAASVNNRASRWIRVHPRTVRVFYAESYYKTENLFKAALEGDGSIAVDFATSLVGFAKERHVPFLKDADGGMPARIADLLAYDCIVLSDVKRSLLSREQADGIRQLVARAGGGLLMVGGMDSFGDGGYVGSEIEDILPVEVSEAYEKDLFLRARGVVENPFRPQLTVEGAGHPITRLHDDAEANRALWDTMPMLGGYNFVGRLKPGAQAILLHPADTSAFGPRVILAVQPFGKGRAIAFTSDVTYAWGQWFEGWRAEGEEWLFAKFWQSAVHWLAATKVALRTSPLSVEWASRPLAAGERAEILIRPTVSAAPLGVLDVAVGRDGRTVLASRLEPDRQAGAWKLSLPPLDGGEYALRASLVSPDAPSPFAVESRFTVGPALLEARHLTSRGTFLANLARASGGHSCSYDNARLLPRLVRDLERQRLRRTASPLWHQAWYYSTMIGLLFGDWFLRKRKQLE